MIFWFVINLLIAWAAASENTTIVLAPGESATVEVSRHGRILLANGKIAKVSDLGSHVRITGKALGETHLSASSRHWTIAVLERERAHTYHRLQEAMKGMLGPELSIRKGAVLVTGELLRSRDWDELKEAAGPQADYQLAVQMAAPLQAAARAKIQAVLAQAHLKVPSLQLTPQAVLQLPLSAKEQVVEYARVLSPYGVLVEAGQRLVDLEPMVRVKIVVAEVRRNHLLQIGIKWPEQAQPLQPETLLSELTLKAFEQKGLMKVLASPNLLCRSGKSAEFLAGGEFPIKIANFKLHDVVWKRHGVLLKVQPQADFAGNMSVSIESEVSMVDPSQSVDGIPGLLTNRIQSHLDLKQKQTIALSGLIKQDWGQTRSGLPVLSRIPVLGHLFASHDYQQSQSELVVFVTPEVIEDKSEPLQLPQGFDNL